MKSLRHIGLLTLLAGSLMSITQAQGGYGVKPEKGFVPDEITAVRIAEAILSPIYGQQKVESERPFSAHLSEGIWKVEGHLPDGVDGGVAEVWIDKQDGRIVRVSHGK